MKIYNFLFLFALLVSEAKCENDPDLSASIEFHKAKLGELLDKERWSINSTVTTIIIESKFDVEGYSLVPAVGSDPTIAKYRIELAFKPKLTKQEFIKLSEARLEHLVKLRYGSETKNEYSESRKFIVANPLPSYRATGRLGQTYSIYFNSSEHSTRQKTVLEK